MTPRPHSPAAVRGWGTDQGEGRVWSVGRRRTAQSASRPSRASGASYSGDEEPSGHPAQIAAAAGRLHCLTITRAGFSPRILRLLLPFSHCGPCLFLWNVLGVLTSVTVFPGDAGADAVALVTTLRELLSDMKTWSMK
ncbi:uncharacterized protein LOC129630309 isoform X6 [Bubalus kerabau]|uniref:uncharacterized protein LOC129630309 isoform X6 n=1 Tax=Bubalus carabanensis TaxID=3119969 RepID=UPI00244EA380|nr:uncharacterized protein LOC129630309 isoform X6 [Bubalus carabanensis]